MSAKWASDTIGENEEIEAQHSRSQSRGPNASASESTSWHHVRRPLILPSEFQSIPPVSHGLGIEGVYVSPHVPGAWSHTLSQDYFPQRPPESHVQTNPDFLPHESTPLVSVESPGLFPIQSTIGDQLDDAMHRRKLKLTFTQRRTP